MKERIACIEWEDASYDSGYYDKKDPERFDVVKVQSVGHIVKMDSKKVIIATDAYPIRDSKGDRDMRHINTIPRKYITKIRYLEERPNALCDKEAWRQTGKY